MKKKIVGMLVMTLLIATAVLPVIGSGAVHKIKASNCVLNTEINIPIAFTNYENGDVLDQNQSDYCGWGFVVWGEDFKLAQSFKPTLNIISRVEMLLYLIGTPGKLEISIRNELSGPDLTSITILGTQISGSQEHWAEFDFQDIGVEPEQTYYIIWSTLDTDSTNYFVWCFGADNPYDRGNAYEYSPTHGWRIFEAISDYQDPDFCFKTYGVHNNPPSIQTCRYEKTSDELIVSAIDIDGNQVRYGISWDNDQNVDQWTTFYDSGVESRINCEGRKGTVGAIAEDEYGAQSEWVSIKSKNKVINTPFLWFLENHPLIYQLLQRFLRL